VTLQEDTHCKIVKPHHVPLNTNTFNDQ